MRPNSFLRRTEWKVFGFDGFTAAGGVDKFAVADVEADMGIFVCAAGIEEDKIAGFNLPSGIFRLAAAISRGAWQIDVEGVFYRRIGSCRCSQSLWMWCCLPICRVCRSGLGCEASIPANLGCGRYGEIRTGWTVLAVVCGLWDLCLPVVPQEANNRLVVQTNRVLQMSRDMVNSSGSMIFVFRRPL